jgi:hypothetical protein
MHHYQSPIRSSHSENSTSDNDQQPRNAPGGISLTEGSTFTLVTVFGISSFVSSLYMKALGDSEVLSDSLVIVAVSLSPFLFVIQPQVYFRVFFLCDAMTIVAFCICYTFMPKKIAVRCFLTHLQSRHPHSQ